MTTKHGSSYSAHAAAMTMHRNAPGHDNGTGSQQHLGQTHIGATAGSSNDFGHSANQDDGIGGGSGGMTSVLSI